MYVALLGALLIIMSAFILGPAYLNKPTFNKLFPVFLFLYFWYFIYTISMLFDIPYSVFLGAAIAALLTVIFHYVKKSRKVAFLNNLFKE